MTRRTWWLLGALAASLLLAVLLDTGGGGGEDAGRRVAARGTRGATGEEGIPDRALPVRTAALDEVASQYEPGRDPFRFYQPPKPPPPPPPPPKEEPKVVVDPTPPPPPVPEGPQPPPVPFKFLGSFGTEERPIAVLADGDEIFNVRLGEVVDEQFRVVRIGYESVDLAFVDFPEEPAERLPVGRSNG